MSDSPSQDEVSGCIRDYVIAEYRYQDQRSSEFHGKLQYQLGVAVLTTGIICSSFRSSAVAELEHSFVALAYCTTAAITLILTGGQLLGTALAARPTCYNVPGGAASWVGYARDARKPTAAGGQPHRTIAELEADLIDELAECADANRLANRQRQRHLNIATSLSLYAAFSLAAFLLFAGILFITDALRTGITP